MADALLLAESLPPAVGYGDVVKVLLALFVALGGGGTIIMLLARGFWAKSVEPVVEAMFVRWQNAPERAELTKKTIRDVIENETKRVDGIIRKEITDQVDALQTELLTAITKIGTELQTKTAQIHADLSAQTIKIETAMLTRNTSDAEHRNAVLSRLSKMEGALNVLVRTKNEHDIDDFSGVKR